MEATEHSHQAAERAVAMAREHKVEALMKGSLHADELLQFVDCPQGLRTARLHEPCRSPGATQLPASVIYHRHGGEYLAHG